eukprot:1158258-Pelagomonas_calceolata.AAC.1
MLYQTLPKLHSAAQSSPAGKGEPMLPGLFRLPAWISCTCMAGPRAISFPGLFWEPRHFHSFASQIKVLAMRTACPALPFLRNQGGDVSLDAQKGCRPC